MLTAQKHGSNALNTVTEQDEVSLKCLKASTWWPQEVGGKGGDNRGCQLLLETQFCAY